MNKKVILILIDGLRPDALDAIAQRSGEERRMIEALKGLGSYTTSGRTTFPPVTLPCHMSLFHSVPPERHGVTTNSYRPPVRPVEGLFEALKKQGAVSAMFYGWEPLRDISRPGSLERAEFIECYSEENTDRALALRATEYILKASPDFVFLYLVETDDKGGHDHGWMTPAYLDRASNAINEALKLWEDFGEDYTFILTADHGGHDRCHGLEIPEDMTIPMFFIGPDFEKGKLMEGISILDIAPTVCDLAGAEAPREWEGKSVLARGKE